MNCIPAVLSVVIALASVARSQNFNVDFDVGLSGPVVPVPSFGGAANQPGFWIPHHATGGTTYLNDITNSWTPVALQHSSLPSYLLGTQPGDLGALMNDIGQSDYIWGLQTEHAGTTFTFHNLVPGAYRVFTYATSMYLPTDQARVTTVGSFDPPQVIDAYQTDLDLASAEHRVEVTDGTLRVRVSAPWPTTLPSVDNQAFVNGFQVQLLPSHPVACEGVAPAACPCGNVGAPGAGCANSTFAAGGRLMGSGRASVLSDDLRLEATRATGAAALFFQGVPGAAVPFGDGLLCTSGPIVRLGANALAQSGAAYPGPNDPAISVRGSVPLAGGTRSYQAWYRNLGPCGAGFNLTNAVVVAWTP